MIRLRVAANIDGGIYHERDAASHRGAPARGASCSGHSARPPVFRVILALVGYYFGLAGRPPGAGSTTAETVSGYSSPSHPRSIGRRSYNCFLSFDPGS